MGKPGDPKASTREERLAAQLRANLRRRKAQARAMTPSSTNDAGSAGQDDAAQD